jgi:hypothetical protein
MKPKTAADNRSTVSAGDSRQAARICAPFLYHLRNLPILSVLSHCLTVMMLPAAARLCWVAASCVLLLLLLLLLPLMCIFPRQLPYVIISLPTLRSGLSSFAGTNASVRMSSVQWPAAVQTYTHTHMMSHI